MLNIEIIYCTPDKQSLIPLTVVAPCTVKSALEQSKLFELFPELTMDSLVVGIFSRRVNLDTLVTVGDRIEVYRPLIIDPKQARRKRAGKRV